MWSLFFHLPGEGGNHVTPVNQTPRVRFCIFPHAFQKTVIPLPGFSEHKSYRKCNCNVICLLSFSTKLNNCIWQIRVFLVPSHNLYNPLVLITLGISKDNPLVVILDKKVLSLFCIIAKSIEISDRTRRLIGVRLENQTSISN